MIAPDVGGGFGPKAGHYPEELTAALVAMKLARPVKWTEDRLEHFLTTTQQRDQFWDVEVACDATGKVQGIRAKCVHDNGAYFPYGLLLSLTSVAPFPGAYAIPAVDASLDVVFTNAVPTTPIRGAGRPNVAYILERTLDTVARNLKIDRAVVRRANFVRTEQMPYQTGGKLPSGLMIQYDSGDYDKCLEMVMRAADYHGFEARRSHAAKGGRWLGMGLASYNEDTGLPPYEGATVKVLPSGRIAVELGSCAQGQGLETIAAQIAADQFDVDPASVIVKTGDTALPALALSTVGSRVTATAGPSIHMAAREVRDKAIKLAAVQLEAAEQDLEITRGAVHIKGIPDKKIALADLAKRLLAMVNMPLPKGFTPGLEATAYHTTERAVYANGSNVAEVEVDVDTGEVKLRNYWVAHDCGTLINPMLVDGHDASQHLPLDQIGAWLNVKVNCESRACMLSSANLTESHLAGRVREFFKLRCSNALKFVLLKEGNKVYGFGLGIQQSPQLRWSEWAIKKKVLEETPERVRLASRGLEIEVEDLALVFGV